jgi:hypothetical protein
MKTLRPSRYLVALAILSGALGCSKKDAAGKILPPQAIASTMAAKFADATAEAQGVAKEAVSSLQQNDLDAAFEKFWSLSERGDLTRDQRIAASAAFVSTLKQTAAAAANGDEKARQLLKAYMASK